MQRARAKSVGVKLVGGAAIALFAIACGGADAPESRGDTAQAICGNGVHPGCGPCTYDSSSPTGASRTCFTCEDEYKQQCKLPPISIPQNPTASASPTFTSLGQDETTITFGTTPPGGCVVLGRVTVTMNGKQWLSDELIVNQSGGGWETFEQLTADASFNLVFWCRGFESYVSGVSITVPHH
jgi:hypothetical protein